MRLHRIPGNAPVTLYAKIEGRNPAYSVKCRIGVDDQDPQVSLALLERHQQACEAAQVAFWRVYAGAGAGAVSVDGR